jgi:Flp pilus assembly protein TadG
VKPEASAITLGRSHFSVGRSQAGSAVVDFTLVVVVLVPMFFAILQLAVIWHIRTTLTSAASEGARLGAAYNSDVSDARQRTSEVIAATFGRGFDDQVSASQSSESGQRIVTVEVSAEVPVLAFWGPTVTVEVQGHAVKEVLP